MQNVLFVLFVVLAVSLAWNTVNVITRNYELQQQVNELETEVQITELENENLKFNIAYYESDEFLELAAREKFSKAKPGERVLLLPKTGDVDLLPEPEKVSSEDQKPQYQENYDQWMYFLFGRQPR